MLMYVMLISPYPLVKSRSNRFALKPIPMEVTIYWSGVSEETSFPDPVPEYQLHGDCEAELSFPVQALKLTVCARSVLNLHINGERHCSYQVRSQCCG